VTIAVGVKYPFGKLLDLYTGGGELPEAIILATDSRWTLRYPSGRVRHEDVAAKLFSIDSHTVVAYAGHSDLGESCLGELQRRLWAREPTPQGPGRLVAQETFRRVYKSYVASKKPLPHGELPLYVLIGSCGHLGQAELCLFQYCNGFEPQPLEDPYAIGWPEPVKRFHAFLDSLIEVGVAKELSIRERHPDLPIAELAPMPIKPDDIAIMVAASLNDVLKAGVDDTVGGRIQCAVITAEGTSLPGLSYTTDPTNEGPGWTRATARAGEIKSRTGILGCYDLSKPINQ